MFTGIVEELGTVRALVRGSGASMLEVACKAVVDDAQEGDSISVNGCCVTVTGLTGEGFTSDLMGETLDRTALGDLEPGAVVNLERALRADSRLGGHLVQGHVDGVGVVTAVQPQQDWSFMTFRLPGLLERYVVEKGSVTVDGVSLTVTAAGSGRFSVGLVPHTLAATTLGLRDVGDRVNIEVDVVAKYVERLLQGGVDTPHTRQSAGPGVHPGAQRPTPEG